MSAVVCVCGGDMVAERIYLPDGRRRFTLTCELCWDGVVEYSRRQPVEAIIGGEMVLVGYINVPAFPDPLAVTGEQAQP